ncbi:rubredoxin [Candidatus Mycobacterium methanotrophicum]|uniref:Rubredoxin n=1 Tax=Candidatus Mycobacterium methanotrophicum TaxID=2943498 RepID=A0ABY4QSK3_9MYCO|nr:rubredoxin [Candidatus Mycobacterium methanotrophicum]UQX13006.1 rubredoxin [Candidatus Mycobacterium methanotrophicum]
MDGRRGRHLLRLRAPALRAGHAAGRGCRRGKRRKGRLASRRRRRNGAAREGFLPATRRGQLPVDWRCPGCGAAKSDFEMVEVARS